MQKELRQRLGTTFAFLGDEIYLRAGHNIPGRNHYGNYPQIEDGIGMVRAFESDFAKLLKRIERELSPRSEMRRSTILTGTMFAPILEELIGKLNKQSGTQIQVVGVENNYFGGDVSVAGLLTGGDLVAARERISGDFAIIPKTMLKSDEEIFLDGMSLAQLGERLGLPVYPVDLDSFAAFLFTPGFSPVSSVI
jgi:NifB/MoaA-like Fe-S oxidoreductase